MRLMQAEQNIFHSRRSCIFGLRSLLLVVRCSACINLWPLYATLGRHTETMSKTITILKLGLQIALTFIATFCIYMVFALLDSDFGFDGLFGLVFFQPIIAIILSGLTIIVCLILGLPIRLNSKVNYWWTTNFYISIIGTIIGLTFLFLSLLPTFRDTATCDLDGQTTLKQITNTVLSISGWFLTAFSLLHFYPPRQLTEKIKTIFKEFSMAQKR